MELSNSHELLICLISQLSRKKRELMMKNFLIMNRSNEMDSRSGKTRSLWCCEIAEHTSVILK